MTALRAIIPRRAGWSSVSGEPSLSRSSGERQCWRPTHQILTICLAALCQRCEATASSSAAAGFRTSAVQHETRRKRISRLKRKSNLEQRGLKEMLLKRSMPDPVLGHQTTGSEAQTLWDVSELKKVLLEKEKVWSGQIPSEQVQTSSNAGPGPQILNFGLSAKDRELLFKDLPEIMVEDRLLDSQAAAASGSSFLQASHLDAMQEEMAKFARDESASVSTLARILDLRNASGKGIQVENIRRIVHVFGDGKDTGSSEVQGTSRCRLPLCTPI